MLRKSLLNMINRWSVHPIQKKKRHFLLRVSLAKTKIIPLRNPPPGEPRSNSQPSWDSWSPCRAWCISGMDLALCPWRRQACQMIKAIYHLHSLKASDVMKPLWFLELREVCDGFPRILIFIQAAICNQHWPSTFIWSFLQTSCYSNIQRHRHRHSGFHTLWIRYNPTFVLFSHIHLRAMGIYLIFLN